MVPALMGKMKIELAAASQSAAATRSANVDTLGADFAEIGVVCGIEANTSAATVAIVVSESDTTDASAFATWSSSFSRDEDVSTAHNVRFLIDTRARKRYLKLQVTNGTHTTNDLFTSAAYSILTRREQNPVGTAGMIGSTNDAVVIG